jgi:hypothetical protein
MKKLLLIFIFVVVLPVSAYSDDLSERIITFSKNAYTGIYMAPEEWMTKEAQAEKLFNHFGGLDSVVKYCTAEAKRNQGLKSINVKTYQKGKADVMFVLIEVIFNNGEKKEDGGRWIKDNGKWKNTCKPSCGDDKFAP